MNKFLIINPFGIGDALFTTPVIGAIKEKHPDSFIGYWCNERVGALLKSVPDINKIFPLSRGDMKRVYRGLKGFAALISLIGQIRKERFDAALDFSLDSRYGLWSKLAGIKRRIGFEYKKRGRFLTDKIKLSGYSGRHVVEYNLELLKFIETYGSVPLSCCRSLEISEEDRIKAHSILKEYGVAATDLLIGMIPGGGASWGRDAVYKQWPAEKFAELADRLIKDLNGKVVLLGSVDEKPIAEIVIKALTCHCEEPKATKQSQRLRAKRSNLKEIASATSWPRNDDKRMTTRNDDKRMTTRNDDGRVINLTGKLNLKELAAVMSELKLLVCNDGGPLHMAVALGVKTVSIFGPVDEVVYGPYPPDVKHVVVKKDLPCRPCYKDFRFAGCSNNRKCMEDITVNEVYDSVSMSLRGAIATKQSK
ncbi:MAG: glycosyltransferase family 9 protein [Candidatus Omnitrophota bacterium]|nr:glycosyltransferase family 9 protein [Candidatus Omnitrophota bacterium]